MSGAERAAAWGRPPAFEAQTARRRPSRE